MGSGVNWQDQNGGKLLQFGTGVVRTRRHHSPDGIGIGNRQSDSVENEHRFHEIMKLTGKLNVDGRVYFSPVKCFKFRLVFQIFFQIVEASTSDFEHIGELGNGTCGHVVKMRYRSTGHVMAIKVCCIFRLSF